MSYLAWKLFHIASVVLFLGNIITGVFWGAYAHRSRDFRLIAATFEGISRSDRWFTIPGVIGIFVSGVALASAANAPILRTGWILWPLLLFAVSGAAFSLVGPLQRRIAGLARAAGTSADQQAAYERAYRHWGFWGFVALVAPLAAFAIMVLKPSLPAIPS